MVTLSAGFPKLITDIKFQNNHTVSTEELEKMVNLRRGMPLDPATNRRACYEIQEYLKTKGRYFANVSLVEGGQPGDTRVVFNLTEGPVVRVQSTHFTGNTFAVEARLRTQIETSRAFLSWFGGQFTPALIESGDQGAGVLQGERFPGDAREPGAEVQRGQPARRHHLPRGRGAALPDQGRDGGDEEEPGSAGAIVQAKEGSGTARA
ncbi:MAG: POTRA domain-containing protein [Gemmataceae bacterium]